MAKNNNKKSEIEKMDGRSKGVWVERLEKLQQEFPEVLSENKVDCERLKKLVGDENVAEGERYQFSWAGKSAAFQEIKKRTTATLKPNREESVNFDKTENLFIEGENLEVLRILQKAYYGEVKMIYIDPPYNTGNDRIYNDRFAESREEYEEKTGDVDEEGKKLRAFRKNTKESGHYHSNWLSMMYPRLYLARNLLSRDGVIFVSIDDNEVHNLRMIMNEIFGEENFVAQMVWNTKKGSQGMATSNMIVSNHEYILVYAREAENFRFLGIPRSEDGFYNPDDDPRGPWKRQYLQRLGQGLPERTIVDPETGINYSFETPYIQEKLDRWVKEDRIIFPEDNSRYPARKEFLREYENKKQLVTSIGLFATKSTTEKLYSLFDDIKIFTNPKPDSLIKFLIKTTTEEKDIVLDFFSGSATTAHAVLQQNTEDHGSRKYIMVQLPEETDENSEARKAGYETIADIAKERIRRAGKKIKQDNKDKEGIEKLDIGFKVFKLSDSNFKAWVREEVKSEEKLQQKLENIVENVKEGARKENMLFELMLKLGINPNAEVEEKESYYSIGCGEYIICLTDKIDKNLVEDILSEEPHVVVCLDSAFRGNDELKTNTALQMKSKDIEFKVV